MAKKYDDVPDIFEERQKELAIQYNKAIEKLQDELQSYKQESSRYDSGLSAIEDREEIRYLEKEIADMKQERDLRIQELSTNQK